MTSDDLEIDWNKRIKVSTIPSKIFNNMNIHYVTPIMYNEAEKSDMIRWCWDNFGSADDGCDVKFDWSYVYDPELMFMFTDPERVTLFILRWS